MIHATINGIAVEVEEGSTILQAAEKYGIHIPTLCYLKELDPRASCRMCVVEVEGARTFQHACAARVREGMVVHTDTEAVRASRKLTLELLLSNHAVDCHHCLRIGSWIHNSARCASTATVSRMASATCRRWPGSTRWMCCPSPRSTIRSP